MGPKVNRRMKIATKDRIHSKRKQKNSAKIYVFEKVNKIDKPFTERINKKERKYKLPVSEMIEEILLQVLQKSKGQ